MNALLPLCLLFPLLLFGQQEPISIGVHSMSYGMNYNSFAKRFADASYMNVLLTNPAYYHQRNIKKVELLQYDSTIFYSVEFDGNGKVLEERRKGNYFISSRQYLRDTLQQRDSLIQKYFSGDKLMRSDTFITQYFQYKHKDTLISFSRQFSNIWYNGALINEQNNYYNLKFLNKKIKPNQGYGFQYDVIVSPGKMPKYQIYLRRKLRTDYDSSRMFHCIKETLDLNFSAAADSGHRTLEYDLIKGHPFVKKYGTSNRRDFTTDGADFNEPVFPFPSTSCCSGMLRAQETHQRTSYGYTSRPDGLFDTFYTDYNAQEEEALFNKEQHTMRTKAERTTLLRFRYTYFQ